MDVLIENVKLCAPYSMSLVYDIVLMVDSRDELRDKLEMWKESVKDDGFKLSQPKKKICVLGEVDQ